jgi:hypothetical protein
MFGGPCPSRASAAGVAPPRIARVCSPHCSGDAGRIRVAIVYCSPCMSPVSFQTRYWRVPGWGTLRPLLAARAKELAPLAGRSAFRRNRKICTLVRAGAPAERGVPMKIQTLVSPLRLRHTRQGRSEDHRARARVVRAGLTHPGIPCPRDCADRAVRSGEDGPAWPRACVSSRAERAMDEMNSPINLRIGGS